MDNCTSGTQRRGDRDIGPFDYVGSGETSKNVSSGETSERVGCSIGSAWVEAGAAFDEGGHDEIWRGLRAKDGHKISFFLGALFSCVELCWARG